MRSNNNIRLFLAGSATQFEPHAEIGKALLMTQDRVDPLLRSHELDALWNWLDNEPALRVAIITGSGRAFCTGANLKANLHILDIEFLRLRSPSTPVSAPPDAGFGGMSKRLGKKPIIAAVNGLCYGGGCEMAVNADLVIASSDATFAIQDVKVGTLACGGVLPRLVLSVGLQRATEMALTGRALNAEEARSWGLVNRVVEKHESVVRAAVDYAKVIAANSPDSIIATREGIRKGWLGPEAIQVNDKLYMAWGPRNQLENYKEGIRAFSERRAPQWVNSKL
ncbi:MAG: hypothetical protein Q9187_001067 [Circinaria calcarea]